MAHKIYGRDGGRMKKLLILPDYQSDYGMDGLHTGLYELGDWDIYEYPIKTSVHGGCDSGYDLPGQPKSGNTGCGSYLLPNPCPGPFHTEKEVEDIFPNFDLIVMGVRDYSRRSIKYLCELKLVNYDTLPLLLVDEEDAENIDRYFIDSFSPKVFFKRELLRTNSIEDYTKHLQRPVFPLPFSAFLRGLPDIDDSQKDYDVFLSLGRTWEKRDDLIRTFLSAVHDHHVCSPDRAWIATNGNSPLFHEKHGEHLRELAPWLMYMEKQGKSKITAAMRGWGRDTMHQFEAFSYATFVLYFDPGVHMPHPFKNKIHCRYVREDEWPVIHHIIDNFLEHDEWRNAVAKAGRDHCRTYHSNKARASYMVDISTRILGGEKVDPTEFGIEG